MIGDRRILEMRRKGIKPTVVWLSDFPSGYIDPEATALSVNVAHDMPEALDLRFLVGVSIVIVEGSRDERLGRLARAAMDAGAQRVITNKFESGKVVRTTDTEGAMAWQN